MIRLAVTSLIVLSLISCAKQKKDLGPITPTDISTSVDESIQDKPIQFDAMGSDGGSINGLSSIYFPYDRADITEAAKSDLAANAQWMNNNANVAIQIEGHCDERGSIEYNLSLGERRANAVKNYLISMGVSPNRLSTISYGEEKPIMDVGNDTAWNRNRRANFVPISQ